MFFRLTSVATSGLSEIKFIYVVLLSWHQTAADYLVFFSVYFKSGAVRIPPKGLAVDQSEL